MRLSITSIGTWLTCRRRWFLEQRWEPPVLPTSLVAGQLFHENLARKLTGRPLSFQSEALDRCEKPDLAVGKARAGLRLWKDQVGGKLLAVEEFFVAKFNDFEWIGKIDAICRLGDGLWVIDHKLTTNPHWEWFRTISDQLMFYGWLLKKAGFGEVVGGIWDVVTLPDLRKKSTETLAEFEERLVAEAESRGPANVVIPTTFTEADLEFIEQEITAISDEIAGGKIFRNPQACAAFPCPYQLICRSDDVAEALGYIPKQQRYEAEKSTLTMP